MKDIEEDKWLKDLFSERPEIDLSSRFESKLMQRIVVLEAEQAEKREVRNRKLELAVGVFGSVLSAVGIVLAFAFFGWYKPLASSWHELMNQFSTMKVDVVMMLPIAVIIMLLIFDLFARKYMER
jgi:hypothetical protein